jgi:hypothetical protein
LERKRRKLLENPNGALSIFSLFSAEGQQFFAEEKNRNISGYEFVGDFFEAIIETFFKKHAEKKRSLN